MARGAEGADEARDVEILGRRPAQAHHLVFSGARSAATARWTRSLVNEGAQAAGAPPEPLDPLLDAEVEVEEVVVVVEDAASPPLPVPLVSAGDEEQARVVSASVAKK